MEVFETNLKGCFVLKPKTFTDSRGALTKIFHKPTFEALGMPVNFPEEYYSVSSKGVVRGLHFQIPPDDHAKCVSCLYGSIFDVVVDIRKSSPTFGQYYSLVLDSRSPALLYIPSGMAHGFVALEESSIFLNRTTTVYSQECDSGIRWDSCGIDWPEMEYIVSDKDQKMPSLKDYDSPF
ncbi:dTDP-4-dehydrorhamnose 3,5-epimerase [Algoriphagus sp. D3-2-R+10]|uniref:dTDP-4-dehydrorhamnose 3,5-epimerase n=1 Tax=Algoriphagus aurantiacus TaxID=3103948 RepID=UPI002B365921|nr:dTDP-4-dehydrorhamnose 3,5-epimerase [Algoriphagus sp. D3-2-R+10]MEB2777653.1 dTDP-4-dehydrorhamnose 3,5-epimerase [Algoriphagus sp. D3-2-R+10]